MALAVELSKRGFPAPNPHVGCVVVRDGEIVGEGWHDYAGGLHAEAVALASAGSLADGADVYVTLEPCNHEGRTPPCSRALIAADVSRAFIAVRDPNPRAGGGIEALESGGVSCEVGMGAEAATAANVAWLTAMKRKWPYVVAKAATTSDGFIAHSDGESKWITGEAARAAGHALRAEMGCVLVGRRTVELDDPRLTARIDGVVNQPLRVVLDPEASLAPEYRVFSDGSPTLRYVRHGRAVREGDVELPNEYGLKAVLQDLFARGVTGVLVEGGAETLASFFRAGLVDRFDRFTSPKVFSSGLYWLGADPPAINVTKVSEQTLGEDLHETFMVSGTFS